VNDRPVADTLDGIFHVSMAVVFLSVAKGEPLTPTWGWVFFGIFAVIAFGNAVKVSRHIRREWDNY
jgi:hypothetical protein